MVLADKIQQYVERLPASFQAEVLDFVEYLLTKVEREVATRDERVWSDFSLSSAMRGMEDEDAPSYTMSDLKVKFQ